MSNLEEETKKTIKLLDDIDKRIKEINKILKGVLNGK